MTILLIVIITGLLIFIICLLDRYKKRLKKYNEVKESLFFEKKPSYNLTIYATLEQNTIVYKIQDNCKQYYQDCSIRPESPCKYSLPCINDTSFNTVTEAKHFISKRITEKLINVNKDISIETIQLQ